MNVLALFLGMIILGALPVYAQQAPMTLESPSFGNGGDFPEKYTCRGSDINPPLVINNVPPKTKTLAITVFDPDAPEGVWVSWVVYQIKPTVRKIEPGKVPGKELLNDFGKYPYAGPCPEDERVHHITFRLYAVDKILEINEGATMKDLEKAVSSHTLAKSELIGVYRKPVWQ